jgi:hypothetical protein
MKIDGWGWPGTKMIPENKYEEDVLDKLWEILPNEYKSIGEVDKQSNLFYRENIDDRNIFISNGE